MILSQEQWMELHACKALAEAGATWAEIARETGHDWRTVKRYLTTEGLTSLPAPARRGPGPRKLDPYAGLVDAWLRSQPRLKASVIHERLVAEHGLGGHYQRVKVYVREARARLDQADPAPAGSPPTIRGPPWGAGPGGLGRRGRACDRDGTAARLQLPHDAGLLPRSVLLLHGVAGPGDVLRLPPAGVRPPHAGCPRWLSTTGPRP